MGDTASGGKPLETDRPFQLAPICQTWVAAFALHIRVLADNSKDPWMDAWILTLGARVVSLGQAVSSPARRYLIMLSLVWFKGLGNPTDQTAVAPSL